MHTISAKINGCVLIDGQPFQIGDLRIKFDGNLVTVSDKMNVNTSLLNATFDQVINPTTGVAFVDAASIQTFVQSNFFDNAAGDALSAAKSYTDEVVSEFIQPDQDALKAVAAVSTSGRGDSTQDNKLEIFCGDSQTWQMTALGSGFDYATNVLRKPGQPMEKVIGQVNFGSSGYPMNHFYTDALGTVPTFDEVNNLGIGNWDFYGHNVQTAISLNTAMAFRAARSEEVIWIIGFGPNDVLLYSTGNLTQDQITAYFINLMRLITQKIKAAFPEDVIVWKMPNPMLARPFNNQGFPSLTVYPTFGTDLNADVALMNKWNYAIRNAYLAIQGLYSKTIVLDTWKTVFGFMDASVNATTSPYHNDIVHPSPFGYIGIMEQFSNLFTPGKERNLSQKRRGELTAKLNGGNAWDFYPNYFDDNTKFRRVVTLDSGANLGSNFVDMTITIADWLSAVNGRAFYISIDGVGSQKITTYTAASTSATTIRLTGVAIIAALQGAKGRVFIYVDAVDQKTNDAYLLSQYNIIKPRYALYGVLNGAGNGYMDLKFDANEQRLSTDYLQSANSGILVIGGTIAANITDLNTWSFTKQGTTAQRLVRLLKTGDQSAYNIPGTPIAIMYGDSAVPPMAYEALLPKYTTIPHAQNNAGRVVMDRAMPRGVIIQAYMTQLLASVVTVEIFSVTTAVRTSLGIITIAANASTGTTPITVSTAITQRTIYEAVITSNTSQTTGLLQIEVVSG